MNKPSMAGILICLACAYAARGQSPKVGDPAPPLGLEQVLQAPPDSKPAPELSWDDFNERVVVLEYWATWCGPCVAAIPHLNELADEFKTQPVTFISITSEDEEKVRTFLGKRPIRTWIGFDTDRSMHKAYAARAIPRTVLVGRDGKIAGITHPASLTAAHIRAVLEGQDPGLNEPAVVGADDEAESEQVQPLYEVVIRKTDKTTGMVSTGKGLLRLEAAPLPMIIGHAYDEPSIYRRVLPDDLDMTTCYSVRVVAWDDDAMQAALQLALKNGFGVAARRETREVDVVVCRAPEGAGKGLTPATIEGSSSWGTGADRMNGVGAPFGTLISQIERLVKKPVIDETGVTGQFDYDIRWKAGDDADQQRALLEATGMTLEDTRRPIDMLVVEVAAKEEPQP